MITNKCHVIMIGQLLLFHAQYSMAHMQIKSQTFSKIAKKTEWEIEKKNIECAQQFAFFFKVGCPLCSFKKKNERNIKCDLCSSFTGTWNVEHVQIEQALIYG